MNSTFLVNGRKYISASRASQEVGYSSDYIGQLCRSNKVPSKLLGRSWYVDIDALIEHKKINSSSNLSHSTEKLNVNGSNKTHPRGVLRGVLLLVVLVATTGFVAAGASFSLQYPHTFGNDKKELYSLKHPDYASLNEYLPNKLPGLAFFDLPNLGERPSLTYLKNTDFNPRVHNTASVRNADSKLPFEWIGGIKNEFRKSFFSVRNELTLAWSSDNLALVSESLRSRLGKFRNLFIERLSDVEIPSTNTEESSSGGASNPSGLSYDAVDMDVLKNDIVRELESRFNTRFNLLARPYYQPVAVSSNPYVVPSNVLESFKINEITPLIYSIVSRQSDRDSTRSSNNVRDLREGGTFTQATISGSKATFDEFCITNEICISTWSLGDPSLWATSTDETYVEPLGGRGVVMDESTTTAATTTSLAVTGALSIVGETITNFTSYVRSLFTGGAGISLSSGDISLDFSEFDTDDITEGLTNRYYSSDLVNSFIHASTTIPKLYTSNTFSRLQTIEETTAGVTALTIRSNITNSAYRWLDFQRHTDNFSLASFRHQNGVGTVFDSNQGLRITTPAFQVTDTGGVNILRLVQSTAWTDTVPTTFIQPGSSSNGNIVIQPHGTSNTRMQLQFGNVQISNLGPQFDTPVPVAMLEVINNSSSKIGSIVRGAASQSANLQEWRDSDNNSLSAVTSDGSLGVGTTTPASELHVIGTIRQTTCVSGTLSADANGDIVCSSDERLKDVFGLYQGGLDELVQINPIVYSFKNQNYTTVGFSAQNVRSAIPEAVPVQVDGYLGLNNTSITALIVNSVKELKDRLDNLLSRIEALEVALAGIKINNETGEVTSGILANLTLDEVWQPLLDRFVDYGIKITQNHTKIDNLSASALTIEDKLCVDDVCISKENLKDLIIRYGGISNGGNLFLSPAEESNDEEIDIEIDEEGVIEEGSLPEDDSIEESLELVESEDLNEQEGDEGEVESEAVEEEVEIETGEI